EGVDAVVAAVAGGECVVGGQHHTGVGIRGGEGYGALIISVDLAVGVQGRDGDVEGGARGGGGRSSDQEAAPRRRHVGQSRRVAVCKKQVAGKMQPVSSGNEGVHKGARNPIETEHAV